VADGVFRLLKAAAERHPAREGITSVWAWRVGREGGDAHVQMQQPKRVKQSVTPQALEADATTQTREAKCNTLSA